MKTQFQYDQLLKELKEKNIITQKFQVNKNARKKLKANPELINAIINATSFFPENTDIIIRIIAIKNNITSRPVCANCKNNFVTFNPGRRCFNTYCDDCKHSAPAITEKRKQTVKEKYIDTGKIKEVYEKRKQTMIKRYGVDIPAKSKEIMKKIIKTKLERYGTLYHANKRRSNSLEKYNVPYPQQKGKDPVKIALSYDKSWLETQNYTNNKTLKQISEELGLTRTVIHKRFQTLNIPVKINVSNPKKGLENCFIDFINKIYEDEIKTNVKVPETNYEIDVLLPKEGIGFELSGIYWHSETKGRDRNYHKNKKNIIENILNIRLIDIWSNEWYLKQEIVKSRIKSLLGLNKKISARKTTIREISHDIKKDFLIKNHLQGDIPSKHNIGLFLKNELVAVMTFGTPRFNKNAEYELLRYACKNNHNVIGGPSKLFSYFIKRYKPKSVISYSDKRWNTGKLYEKLGFEYIGETEPNYYYFYKNGDTNKLYHRVYFQKHKLRKILKAFDPQKTEWENMLINGYDRIWDCGNDVYLWKGNR